MATGHKPNLRCVAGPHFTRMLSSSCRRIVRHRVIHQCLALSSKRIVGIENVESNGNRRFSSVDSPAEAAKIADAAKLNLDEAVGVKQNSPLFPWRHETSENLLPRLQFGSPEYLADVRLPNDIQGMLAVMFLKVPFWKVFFGTSWRDELAESCAFAFAQGTAGIISNVYKVPYHSVNGEGGVVDFRNYMEEEHQSDSNGDSIDGIKVSESSTGEAMGEIKGEEIGVKMDSDSPSSGDDSDAPDATDMLDRPLRRIFQSAHDSGRDQLIIRLRSQPKRALLYTVFGVPFLTKARAEGDTSLLNRIRELLSLVREDPDTAFSGLNDFIRQESAWGKDKMDTTIEVQVLVECEEQFQVRDRKTGIVVQGSEDGLVRTVMHLVRLETNVSWRGRFPQIPSRTQENWRITDIDDLVGSKKWYHKH